MDAFHDRYLKHAQGVSMSEAEPADFARITEVIDRCRVDLQVLHGLMRHCRTSEPAGLKLIVQEWLKVSASLDRALHDRDTMAKEQLKRSELRTRELLKALTSTRITNGRSLPHSDVEQKPLGDQGS